MEPLEDDIIQQYNEFGQYKRSPNSAERAATAALGDWRGKLAFSCFLVSAKENQSLYSRAATSAAGYE